jgi:asparagine synthase (glutamine-hydrolysing)
LIQFLAVQSTVPGIPLREESVRRILSGNFASSLAHRQMHKTASAVLVVAGDREVRGNLCSVGDFTVVCDADLLQPLPGPEGPAEAVAGLLDKQGPDFVKGLRGTFGIVAFNHRTSEMRAWTDHCGIRRIVFAREKDLLAVASDIRFLLPCLSAPPDIDPEAVFEYLQYTCIPAPRTVFKGIGRLEPGHAFSSTAAGTAPYWILRYPETRQPRRAEEAWAKDVEQEIRNSVERHLRFTDDSTKPGCFLSGGTDSSSVTGLVGQITGKPPRSFSIGFDDPRYNEISYARIAARSFGADHHEYFVTPGDVLELIPRAVECYDEPFGNSSVIPTYYCARLAAQSGVTHLLAGDGGDELFGGNERYVSDLVFQHYYKVPRFARQNLLPPVFRLGAALGLGIAEKAAKYARRASVPPPQRYFSYSFMGSTAPSEVLSPGFLESLTGTALFETAARHFHDADAVTDLNRWLYLDMKMTITDNDARKVTPMTESAGVVPRYPLLDADLAEFSGKLPSALKVNGSQLRYIFKKAMEGVLPGEIIRKKKHGFGLPYSVWVGEYKPLRDFTFDALTSSRCRQRGFFRSDLFEWLWNRYETVHRIFYGDVIWQFLMLELWQRSYEREIVNHSAAGTN